MPYLQTSTENPYGRRPWNTALYTAFENYAFLKQPQNWMQRDFDPAVIPRIYRPPEMKPPGMGALVVLSRTGRRHRLSGLGLIPAMMDARYNGFSRPISPIVSRGPIVVQQPTTSVPILSYPPIISILPPSLVPPVPTPVAAGPGGTVYALPGNATTPGSPFAPPAAASAGPPGSVPIARTDIGVATAAAPVTASSLADWFNSATWVTGIPNGYVAIGIAGALFLMGRKK